jgi:tetratricopeptide (TPR) repeat protein
MKPAPLILVLAALTVPGCDEPDGAVASLDPVTVGLEADDPGVARLLRERIEAVRREPQSADPRGALGLAYDANGFDQAALTTYAQAQALAPEAFEWPYLQAIILQKLARLDEALALLERAIALNPDHAPAWLWQGFWLLDRDQAEAAERAFTRALASGAGPPAQVGLARVELRRGDHVSAIERLERLTADFEHPQAYRLLGSALRDTGRLDEARLAFEHGDEARELSWEDPVLDRKRPYIAGFGGRMLTAESLMATGATDEAMPILETLLTDYPEHPTLLNLVAVAHSQLGDEEASLAILERAASLAPEYYPIHLNLAGAYENRGDYERALSHLDRAAEIHPSFGVVHERKGVVLMRLERHEEALAALAEAARLDARKPEVFYFAGVIESMNGNWADAITRFERAVQVDPTFTRAWIHLARALGELRRFGAARAALDAADELGDERQDARRARAWLDRLEASGA